MNKEMQNLYDQIENAYGKIETYDPDKMMSMLNVPHYEEKTLRKFLTWAHEKQVSIDEDTFEEMVDVFFGEIKPVKGQGLSGNTSTKQNLETVRRLNARIDCNKCKGTETVYYEELIKARYRPSMFEGGDLQMGSFDSEKIVSTTLRCINCDEITKDDIIVTKL